MERIPVPMISGAGQSPGGLNVPRLKPWKLKRPAGSLTWQQVNHEVVWGSSAKRWHNKEVGNLKFPSECGTLHRNKKNSFPDRNIDNY